MNLLSCSWEARCGGVVRLLATDAEGPGLKIASAWDFPTTLFTQQ